MITARTRSLLAATAVAAVFAYGLSAHVMPQMNHEGMAGAAAGLCLLLVTVLPYVAVPKGETRHPAAVADVAFSYVATPRIPLRDARARASPRTLQRFRN
jgi:hypothetical protein